MTISTPLLRLPNSRQASIRFYDKVLTAAAERSPGALVQARRVLGRQDLFFLLVYYLGRKDINRDWLFDRCREVQSAPNGHLDLWARDHYKSTIITVGLSIQDVLASHGDDPLPTYGGREATIGVFSHSRPIAKAFLKQIKREFELNEALRRDFADVLWANPAAEAPQWSEDGGIIVKRRTNPKEATIEAWGLVDGQPTSKHFFIRVYDDVVTRESVSTAEQIRKTTEAWELSTNLGTNGGWERYIGTRYHLFDSYAEMMRRGTVKPRIYPATKDGTDNGEPVLLTVDELAKKRQDQGPYTFAMQMLQNPLADRAQGFREEWLRYWSINSLSGLNVMMVVDPASGRNRERGRDPASGQKRSRNDYTSIWVIGLGGDGNFYVVDMVRDRLNLTERANVIFDLHRKYRPTLVGYEQYGLQADIEHIKDRQERENYRFKIEELGGRMAKEDRIRRLVPHFEQGRVYLPNSLIRRDWEGRAVDLVRTFLEEEYLAFPVLAHDDMLDSLSRICDDGMKLDPPSGDLKPKLYDPYQPKQRQDWMTRF